MMSQKIRFKGVEYPSQAALARALSMNPATITYHLAVHGNLDKLGGGKKQINNAKPITWNGVYYPSRRKLRDALGMRKYAFEKLMREHDNAN